MAHQVKQPFRLTNRIDAWDPETITTPWGTIAWLICCRYGSAKAASRATGVRSHTLLAYIQGDTTPNALGKHGLLSIARTLKIKIPPEIEQWHAETTAALQSTRHQSRHRCP